MEHMTQSELNRIRGIEPAPTVMTLSELEDLRKKAASAVVPLTTQDGQFFGEASHNAFTAIANNMIDSYIPASRNEQITIDNYKNYVAEKSEELQNIKIEEYKQTPAFVKYGIDPVTFDTKEFKKLMAEQGIYSYPMPTKKDTKKELTKEEKDDFYKLSVLAANNDRKKGSVKEAVALSAIDAATLGFFSKGLDKLQEYTSPYALDYLFDNKMVTTSEYLSTLQKNHPVASTIGSVGGGILPIAGVSGAVSAAAQNIKWLASAPKWIQSAINSGVTFGALGGAKTAIKGGNVKDTLVSTVIGVASGALSGAASQKTADLINLTLTNPKYADAFFGHIKDLHSTNAIKNVLSSTVFAGTGVGVDYAAALATGRPTPTSKDIATSFAVALIFSLLRTDGESKQLSEANKLYIKNEVEKYLQEYESLNKAAKSTKDIGG